MPRVPKFTQLSTFLTECEWTFGDLVTIVLPAIEVKNREHELVWYRDRPVRMHFSFVQPSQIMSHGHALAAEREGRVASADVLQLVR